MDTTVGIRRPLQWGPPSVANTKWLFLSDRKLWDSEIKARAGSLLVVAQSILKQKNPLPTYDHIPPFVLAHVSATEKYLCCPLHRKLFDSVAQLFLVHHKVQLPYRILVKISLLSPQVNTELTSGIHGVIDRQSVWPSYLKTYLKSRAQLIRAKTSTVLPCVLKHPLQCLPTDAFPWGAWPRDAAVDTHKQAGRQSTALTGASLRSCHVTKRFRILATLKQGNKSMYSNTSGYVHMGLRLGSEKQLRSINERLIVAKPQ